MPLFKRRTKDDEGEEKDQPPKPEESPEEGLEKKEAEGAEVPVEAPGETPDSAESEDEDDDVPSIDELLTEVAGKAGEPAPGMTDLPVELEAALGELAGEDVQLIKMARKVVVIGDPAVGKTSLIKRYVQDVFDDRYLNTIGAKVMKKSLGVKRPETGEIVDLRLILWDIAGQESFNTVKKAYYRGASGAIVVCDVTRKETMEHMHRWIENLFDVSDVIPLIIIINKVDLEGESQFSRQEVADEYAPYYAEVHATSAKTGENVEMVFHELGKLISK